MAHLDPSATRSLGVWLLTVSDTRVEETDESGSLARTLCEAAGHRIVGSRIVPDEPAEVAALIRQVAASGSTDLLICNGGTGISARDRTYEAVAGLLHKRLDGFGELFRSLSFAEIGARAMLSRAVGGVCGKLVVFALPGSAAAVQLGVTRLILPVAVHLCDEVAR